MLNNILNCYHLAKEDEKTKGKLWYLEARIICKRISKETNTPFIVVCGVMAALSPQNYWEQNIKDCKAYILDSNYNPATYKIFKRKAEDIIIMDNPTVKKVCKVLNGQKITRFFMNIYSRRYNVVTIDRHAIAVYHGTKDHNFKPTPKRIAKIRDEYRKAAKIVGIKPYQLQAITWVAWKRISKEVA